MRALRTVLLLAIATTAFAAPAGTPMPPNTVMLSTMMQQLSAQPGFTEAFLSQIEGGAKKSGAALLTPSLVDELRKLILGKDWQGLDHFPGWTMRRINPTVRVIGHVAGKDPKVEDKATAGGAPSGTPGASSSAIKSHLDIGPYALDSATTIDLTRPSMLPGFDPKDLISSLGDGVTRGDGPSPLAITHSDSQRLAYALNRLAANGLDGVTPASATWQTTTGTSPQQLMQAIAQSGNDVTVQDTRYFANFGHLHFNGQDVMMPFYVDTEIVVPHQHRPLLVPVSHAEYEWHIRGPHLNADISFYFGIDGKAEWRTMDQLDQAWVMKRNAHTYTGADAIEITRLNTEVVHTYAHLHAAHPTIPFGGYYGFGVCQDVVAAVELKMTGKATLFPNTADETFFTDPRDAEIDNLIKRLPKDRNGRAPEPERIFGSLPVGSSDAELATISIPGLADDLIAVHKAWTDGTLHRTNSKGRRAIRYGLLGLGLVLLGGVLLALRKTKRNKEKADKNKGDSKL